MGFARLDFRFAGEGALRLDGWTLRDARFCLPRPEAGDLGDSEAEAWK